MVNASPLAVWLTAGTLSIAQDDQALRDRFLREAPKAWQRYLAKAVNLQATVERKITVGKVLKLHRRLELKQRYDCAFCTEEMILEAGKAVGKKYLWAANPQYEFHLIERKKELGLDIAGSKLDAASSTHLQAQDVFGAWYRGAIFHPIRNVHYFFRPVKGCDRGIRFSYQVGNDGSR